MVALSRRISAIGLLISVVLALLFLVYIAVASLLGLTWYWGAAMAFFTAPVAFAVILFLTDPSRILEDRVHA